MKRVILTIFLSLSIISLLIAQNDTVVTVKSKDKVMIGGQPYYVHIVKKGETLYTISKVYGVTQIEIAKENPEIFLGLQEGQALKIPVIETNSNNKQNSNDDFIYHHVKKGQTLYSLSKKYDVSQEDIIACNPSVRYGINVDQIVKIPKSKNLTDFIQKIPVNRPLKDTLHIDDNFIYHKVQKDETVYSLARLYDITEDILFNNNPIVKEGLKVGQVLKIPKVYNQDNETVLFRSEKSLSDTLPIEKRTFRAYSDSISNPDCQKLSRMQKEPFQVAVFLPFYLDKNDEEFYVDSSEVDDYGKKIYERVYYDPFYIYPRSVNFVEFYEGLLLAIDTLKQNGLSINLHVYDTQNDTNRIKEILGFPELRSMDLIIGPIYNQEIKIVSAFSRENHIKLVSPISDNINFVDNNPYLFQVFPSYNSQIEEFAKYASKFRDKNIILVHNDDSLAYSNIELVKNRIFSYLSIDTLVNNIQFKEVVFKDSINVLEHALDPDIENVFIVPSNEEAFVTTVVTNLNTLKTFGHQIKVIGFSKWQRFYNIDPEYFFNLGLCISTPFFIDYHDKDVKNFILKYRKVYDTEPEQMAIHGYDIGLYFLSALMNYGKNFENCIYNYKVDLLQADYQFVKWYKSSGYENVDVSIVKYFDDYHISRIQETNNELKQFTHIP